jgi:hypothetical protein
VELNHAIGKGLASIPGLAVTAPLVAEEPVFSYPLIKGYGGIAIQPDAVEQPRRGAKIVFDITADTKADEVHRGIEAVARYLNLNGKTANPQMHVRD